MAILISTVTSCKPSLLCCLHAICNLHPHDLILLTIFWTPPSGSIELNNSFSSQVRLALSVGSWGLVAM